MFIPTTEPVLHETPVVVRLVVLVLVAIFQVFFLVDIGKSTIGADISEKETNEEYRVFTQRAHLEPKQEKPES
ncbi:MAG: hypothetical protein OXG24_04830 [Gammaproteobacteria bacterium]|nr:hypothetical protein [Gammaproteobacteria bacterium]